MAHETEHVDIVQGETVPLTLDTAPALDPADTIASVSVSVYEQGFSTLIPLAARLRVPNFEGKLVNITVEGERLRARDTYRLVTMVTIAADEKVIGIVTPLHCVT